MSKKLFGRRVIHLVLTAEQAKRWDFIDKRKEPKVNAYDMSVIILRTIIH